MFFSLKEKLFLIQGLYNNHGQIVCAMLGVGMIMVRCRVESPIIGSFQCLKGSVLCALCIEGNGVYLFISRKVAVYMLTRLVLLSSDKQGVKLSQHMYTSRRMQQAFLCVAYVRGWRVCVPMRNKYLR